MNYYTFRNFLKKSFPSHSVFKIPVDAGFTCPNRDGSAGADTGCIYCENRSFSPNTTTPLLPLRRQIQKGIDFYKTKYNADKFIVYFQAYSNTYAPPDKLKAIYDTVLEFPDIAGISIGTRPDCVPDETLDIIESYSDKYQVWMEYGCQSIHDSTLRKINRGHSFTEFEDAVRRTKNRNILICAHVILGLPGETREMMLQTAQTLAEMELDGIKIHHLYVAKNTPLEKLYAAGKLPLLSLDDYIDILTEFISCLPEKTVVQRIMGELSGEFLIAPKWEKSKQQILALINQRFEKQGLRQGKNFIPKTAGIRN